jgi:hypothetical protein
MATTGDLLVPFDPCTRGREHLYRAANPAEQPVVELSHAVALARRLSTGIARATHEVDPAAHPQPANVARSPSHPPPSARHHGNRIPRPVEASASPVTRAKTP